MPQAVGTPRSVVHSKPAGHGKHITEVAGAYSLLVHGKGAMVGSRHLLPAGQFVHAFAPSNAANVPAEQRIGNAVEVLQENPFGHRLHVVCP